MNSHSSAHSSSVIIKKSSINRKGAFALQIFRKGEVVIPWTNTREITEEEYNTLSAEEKQYIEIQGSKIFLVAEPERYVNHSCVANTHPGDRCDIASRDIQIGEEITADYRHFHLPSGPFPCACGTPQCRGVITGRAQLP